MKKIDVLIIDDSPAFNHLTKILVERSGMDCNIKQLSNGQVALHHLDTVNRYPQLILLDINMPVMDGFDFLSEYVCRPGSIEQTKVYMLTSSPHETDRRRAETFDIVKGYFEKPLTEENLEKIMSDLDMS
jgi:CheY-like chemotaxis protein